mmetsp:Transcript_44156/g.136467  ORF Transcript_44156/g.136467 Transcript_44156/m.136467 type:complete len:450 (-) Transcript_44156:76-1425(-)
MMRMAGPEAEAVTRPEFVHYLCSLRGDVASDRLLERLEEAERRRGAGLLACEEDLASLWASSAAATADLESGEGALQRTIPGYALQVRILLRRVLIQWWRRNAQRGLFFAAIAAGAVVLAGPAALRFCGATGAMAPYAASYANVRAIGMPFDLCFRVANAGLLATRDSRTGLLIVLGQSLINGVGDAFVCPTLGIAGAALTTVTAQAAGCLAALAMLRHRGLISRFEPPAMGDALSFFAFALPVCLTLALKVATVQFLNLAASTRGVYAAAAHQVTKSIFWVFGLLAAESLSSTAQSFLPGPLKSGDRASATRTLRLLLLLGTLGAVATSGVLGVSIACGGLELFTKDAGVLATVPKITLCLCVLATPYAFCLEGVHIAAQRQRWLSQRLFVLTSLAMAAFRWGPGDPSRLGGLWGAFGFYIVGRAVWYAWGIWGPGGVLRSMVSKPTP